VDKYFSFLYLQRKGRRLICITYLNQEGEKMLKFTKSNLFVLSLSLLIMPCLLSTENLQNDKLISSVNNQQVSLANEQQVTDLDFALSILQRPRDLSLRDFEGEWVYRSSSIGGVSGVETIGASVVVDGQVSINY
jgi:hypothetical protein